MFQSLDASLEFDLDVWTRKSVSCSRMKKRWAVLVVSSSSVVLSDPLSLSAMASQWSLNLFFVSTLWYGDACVSGLLGHRECAAARRGGYGNFRLCGLAAGNLFLKVVKQSSPYAQPRRGSYFLSWLRFSV